MRVSCYPLRSWLGRVLVVALCVGLSASGLAWAQNLAALSAVEAAASVRAGEVTSRELVEALLAQADVNEGLNAVILLNRAGALAAADVVDAAVAAGEDVGPLAGVPIVIKDNIALAGLPTTAGTPALADFVPKTTAPVLQALVDAGAVVLAKTNMHELSFGVTSNNGAFGRVGNAVAPDRIAGGSSGGTAAAVAASLAPAGLGTDTNGSVRVPAALNGVAGLRPTTGRYPAEGIVPISHTRDTAGPMARTVADLVLLDGVVTSEDTALEAANLAGLRLGIAHPLADNLSPATAAVFQDGLDALEEAGAVLVDVDLAAIVELEAQAGLPIVLYEARRDIPAFLTAQESALTIEDVAAGIASPDVRATFDAILGAGADLPEAYEAALGEQRPALQAAYSDVVTAGDLDALVFPTTPVEALPFAGNEETLTLNSREVPTLQTYIRNTNPGSLAGLPGLTVPIGTTPEGLPVGLGLDGPAGGDRDLLAIGLAIEALR